MGHTEIVKTLGLKEKDLNIPDNNGETPMHMAASHGYIEIVKYFCRMSNSFNNNSGRLLIIVASEAKHRKAHRAKDTSEEKFLIVHI